LTPGPDAAVEKTQLHPELNIEVSKSIKDEFSNGREYYALHGKKLLITPASPADLPSSTFLEWHNSAVYKG
jgi:putative restriction endonuclease